MSKTELLKNLPAVDQVLRCEALDGLRSKCPRPQLVGWIRVAIDDCRKQILGGHDHVSESLLGAVVGRVQQLATADDGQAIKRVINATGVLLHTNLGRAPLADRAIERMSEAAAYANVELDLESGKRSKRGERVTRLLAELTGAEAALVVNNCAAATVLVLQAIARDREVIVSRGQLVEIGGGFRLPDVFRAAGVILREVGTTNRTYLHDYEHACCEQSGAIIRVHRSNFRQTGFVTEPSIDELVDAKRPADVPVIDDLGSGLIHDLSALGLHEPSVRDSVRSGADLTLFSGDKLFGGPQAGMIVGRKRWIDVLARHPLMRAMRVDKVTLAALEATTEIHLAGNAMSEIPLLRMLSVSADQIRQRCRAVLEKLPSVHGVNIEIVNTDSQVGGGSVPGVNIASHAIRITGTSTDELARKLRLGTPAVQSRVTEDGLLLDLRSVAESELDSLAIGLNEALTYHG